MTNTSKGCWIRALSGLCLNLSATWFAVSSATPILAESEHKLLVLTGYVLNGMVYLYLSVKLDELLDI